MIVERITYFAKMGKQQTLIERIKAKKLPPEVPTRLYVAATGRSPQVVWEMEFQNEEERVKWYESWLTPESTQKASEYVDYWETQFLTLVE